MSSEPERPTAARLGAIEDQTDASRRGNLGPIWTETYDGENAQDATEQFTSDADELRGFGYRPVAQSWQGNSLTVIYETLAPAQPAMAMPLQWGAAAPGSVWWPESRAGDVLYWILGAIGWPLDQVFLSIVAKFIALVIVVPQLQL